MSLYTNDGWYYTIYNVVYDLAALAVKILAVGALFHGIKFLVAWEHYVVSTL